MPEGDTIHRIATRLEAALTGREIEAATAPSARSPLHDRAGELAGRTLESVEARGKHLLLHFSGDVVVHSHLGINGRWQVRGDGEMPRGRPWLVLASGAAIASQRGGKLLRMTSAARARNDPVLLRLGPDPLAPGFDPAAAAARLLAYEPTTPVGEALLDQALIAGIGNVIRVEACFLPGVSPWRRVAELEPEEARAIVDAAARVMSATLATGNRPKQLYGRAPRPCRRCGGRIETRGQGDDNRVTYWCADCQR
ncbi:MAG TPA: DNA-formamidopyrimidine glycosylase family protein [Solirubrobacterales bacterium]|nr:DNA-formamidopyrimidine glycosylase family protein [Solirubrobacterales bacterium]